MSSSRRPFIPNGGISYENLEASSKTIAQMAEADRKIDLADLLENDTTEHRYFTEPYAESESRSPWKPQVTMSGDLLSIPPPIQDQFRTLECSCYMGLLPEINRAWIAIDNRLFLWNYETQRWIEFNRLHQCICAVGLVDPKPDVFVSEVKHLLVVATHSEIVLLAVCFTGDSINDVLELHQSELPSVPTEGVRVRKICGTGDGKVFLACHDGHLYELRYDSGGWLQSWLGWPQCRKICQSSSLLRALIPPFLAAFGGATPPLIDCAHDPQRNRLYSLSENGRVEMYSVEGTGVCKHLSGCSAITSASKHIRLSRDGSTKAVSAVSISVVSMEESKRVRCVVVLSTGVRVFLGQKSHRHAFMELSKLKGKLDCIYVRAPPLFGQGMAEGPTGESGVPPDSLLQGSKLLQVTQGIYSDGMAIISDGTAEDSDGLVIFARDYARRQLGGPSFSESFHTAPPAGSGGVSTGIRGRVRDMHSTLRKRRLGTSVALEKEPAAESSSGGRQKRKASEITETASTAPIASQREIEPLGGLAFQHTERAQDSDVLVLTTEGLYRFRRVWPVEQLQNILQNVSSEAADQFFRMFGREESCAMCLAVACRSLDRLQRDCSSRVAELALGFMLRCAALPSGLETIASAPPPGVRQRQSLNFSGRYYGLAIVLSRLLRPFWNRPVTMRQENSVYGLTFSPEAMEKYHVALKQLLTACQRCGFHHAVSGEKLLSGTSLLTNGTVEEGKDPAIAEAASIGGLYLLLRRTVHALSLIKLLSQFVVPRLVARCEPAHALAHMTFRSFVTSVDGQRIAKELVNVVVRSFRHDEEERLARFAQLLLVEARDYFDAGDSGLFAAQADLDTAERATSQQRETLLQGAVKQLCDASHHWVAQFDHYLPQLQYVCYRLHRLGYHRGIVQLCLTVAFNLTHSESDRRSAPAALNPVAPVSVGAPELNQVAQHRVQCYECILSVLDDLLKGKPPPVADASLPAIARDSPDVAVKNILVQSMHSPDKMWHECLYNWLLVNNHSGLLVELRPLHPTFLEDFLRERSPELLCRHLIHRGRAHEAATIAAREALDAAPQEIYKRVEKLAKAVQYASSESVGAPGAEGNSLLSVARSQAHGGMDVTDWAKYLAFARIQLKLLDKIKADTRRLIDGGQTVTDQRKALVEVGGLLLGADDLLQQLELHWVDVQELYQIANDTRQWSIGLELIHALDGTTHVDAARRLWENIFLDFDQSQNRIDPEVWISGIKGEITEIGQTAPGAFPVPFIVERLETRAVESRMASSNSYPLTWVVDAMRGVGVGYKDLCDVYRQLFSDWRARISSGGADSQSIFECLHLLRVLRLLLQNWYDRTMTPGQPGQARRDLANVAVKWAERIEEYIALLRKWLPMSSDDSVIKETTEGFGHLLAAFRDPSRVLSGIRE